MSVIKPNKNFYNEGPDYIFDYQAHISSSALTKNNINIRNQPLNDIKNKIDFYKKKKTELKIIKPNTSYAIRNSLSTKNIITTEQK